MGIAYYYSPDKKVNSISYFENYLDAADSAQIGYYGHHHVYFFLAKMYHLTYQFDQAQEMYLKFISEIWTADYVKEEKTLMIKDAERHIENCEFGKILIHNPRNVVIDNLGDTVNTIYPEYAGVISQDEKMLIFTSRRPDTKGGKKAREGGYYEDIYRADLIKGSLFAERKKMTDSTRSQYFNLVTDFEYANFRKVNNQINSNDHDGSIQLDLNDSILFFYRNSDIWSVPIEFDTAVTAEKLGVFVNSDHYEPSIFFSYDESRLFIVSDRPGGYGGLDIYVANRTPENEWSIPVNLGPNVNTPYDEDAPYLDPDGTTLYFSSKGHSSMGEYDVFRTTIKDTLCTAPVNLGFPINTPAEDIYFTMTRRYNRGYYSSSDLAGKGDLDLYRITFTDERDPVAELMGLIKKGDEYEPAHSKITLTCIETSEAISQETDTIVGDYFLLLGHGKTYRMIVETDEFAPYQRDFVIPEQKEYFQLYQEIHHVHLYNDKGEIIGQQITVYNALGEADSETIYYDESTQENIDKIKNDNQISCEITASSEIRFYISEDSLRKLMNANLDLDFNLDDGAAVYFLNDPNSDVFDTDSYHEYLGSLNREEFLNLDSTQTKDLTVPEGTTNANRIKGLFFTVQIGVYSRNVDHSVFFNLDSIVTEKLPEQLFRYSTGVFYSLEAANKRREEIVKIGITDAFVTAYYNGERLLLTEAEELLEEYGMDILYSP